MEVTFLTITPLWSCDEVWGKFNWNI